MFSNITEFLEKIEKTVLIKVIREALTSLIPVVLIGAFALVVRTLPIEVHQNFIQSFASGFIFDLADLIFNATFGMLSLYMTFFVSRCYMRRRADTESVYSGAVIASMVSFFILDGINLKDFSTDCTSAKSMFLAIDDFSMGQTSINYMKDRIFDIIKLDGSLVKGLFDHENTSEIVSSIVLLASSIDMMVLAEFVENEQQREELHRLGCNIYQGYLYSPAVLLDK